MHTPSSQFNLPKQNAWWKWNYHDKHHLSSYCTYIPCSCLHKEKFIFAKIWSISVFTPASSHPAGFLQGKSFYKSIWSFISMPNHRSITAEHADRHMCWTPHVCINLKWDWAAVSLAEKCCTEPNDSHSAGRRRAHPEEDFFLNTPPSSSSAPFFLTRALVPPEASSLSLPFSGSCWEMLFPSPAFAWK